MGHFVIVSANEALVLNASGENVAINLLWPAPI